MQTDGEEDKLWKMTFFFFFNPLSLQARLHTNFIVRILAAFSTVLGAFSYPGI